MVRFEEVLAEHLSQPLRMPELCALVAVSDRTLRLCCAEFLGMSPTQYLLLRRLKEVRRALRDAKPHMVNVAEVARRFGFAAGSATNTTTAFDGYYGHAVARGLSPGCPDYVTGHELTIRDGLATFHTNTVPATGSGIPATGPLNFQGYVNPQGGLAMVSQQGQTFQGQIDSNFVLTGRASGPNCLYDATFNRMRGL